MKLTTRSDYDEMLRDLGLTAEIVQQLTDIQIDRIEMPIGDYKFMIGYSAIAGMGVIATEDIKAGEVIGPVRIQLNRTPLGYRTNHAGDPNATTETMPDGSGNLVARKDITAGDEITIDYRQAVREAAAAETVVLAGSAVSAAWRLIEALIEDGCPKMAMREAIDILEYELTKLPQAAHGLQHLFCDKLYIRVATIPQGCLFTTPVYKEECVLTILRGRLIIVTENGARAITAPYFTTTAPGTKRVIFAIDEVEAHTVHPNPDNEQNVEILESRIYAPNFKELAGGSL